MKKSELPLQGYEFSGCAVRRKNIVAFYGTKWNNKDALEAREAAVFYYYHDEPPEEQWAFTEFGSTTGVHLTAAFAPDERWVFVMDDGEVYVAGGGDNGIERRISTQRHAYVSNVRTGPGGYAYAVGPGRSVFLRDAPNRWIRLDRGLPAESYGTDAGFRDIDGFGESEIYACGGRGDLWIYDGRRWSQLDVPTNAALWKICCGADGLVYILTAQKKVLVGRRNSWQVIDQTLTEAIFEQLVWYRDRIYISTEGALFEVFNGALSPCTLGAPKQDTYSNLASGDGLLLTAGANEACMYDGKQWSKIL